MHFLTDIHPALPYALATLCAFVAVWAFRYALPHAWEALADVGPSGKLASKTFQALPSVMLSSLAAAVLAGGGYRDAVIGAVLGALNPLIHEFAKASSLPLLAGYVGGRFPAATQELTKRKRKKAGSWPTLLVLLVLGLGGCSSTPSQETTTAAKCAGIRALYDQAQTELIDRGACDHVDVVSACLPHVALREALVASLQEAKCH